MPGSPLIKTTWPCPSSLVCCQARRNKPISSSRPTSGNSEARDAPDLNRFADALERMRAESLVGEDVADQIARRSADQDRVGTRETLQPSGKVGRVANDGLLACGAFADRLADHDNPA